MKSLRKTLRPLGALLGCALIASASVGCQTSIGGQTLPSAFFLTDDIQFHPAGSEDQLTNQKASLENYNAQRAGVVDGGIVP